jgi:hypothetical protein
MKLRLLPYPIALLLSVISCLLIVQCSKKNDKPKEEARIFIWCSDMSAEFPIIVTAKINGSTLGIPSLKSGLKYFDCSNANDSGIQQSVISLKDIESNTLLYSAVDKKGKRWTGSLTLVRGCNYAELSVKNVVHAGAFFFSQAGNIAYPITVTLDNIDSGTISGKSLRSLSCDSATTTVQPFKWFYLDTTGAIPYHAKAASGETWTGTVNLYANHCSSVELVGDTAAVQCTSANLTGNWERQDDGAYPNSKGMIISYSQSQGGLVSFAPPLCCYKNTDNFWSIVSANDCSVLQYEKNASCQFSTITSTEVKFSSLKVIRVNGIQYLKK